MEVPKWKGTERCLLPQDRKHSRGKGGLLPPPQVFDTSVNPTSTRVRGADCAHHITTRLRIFRPSYGPAVLLQNQCVATACRNRISIANPILAPALLAFFVPVEMPGTMQWNLGKSPFLEVSKKQKCVDFWSFEYDPDILHNDNPLKIWISG